MRRLFALFILGLLFLVPAAAQQYPGGSSNLIEGTGSATGTGATTIIAAISPASLRMYIAGVQCARSDTGTSAIYVTFNDLASSTMVLPNNGGGGGNNMVFGSPLIVAANTAFTFTASSGVSTVYCNAQGHSGP